DKHVVAGESDFGADAVYNLLLSKGGVDSDFGKMAGRVLTPAGVLTAAGDPGESGSDVGPTVEAGVPAFLMAQNGLRYFDLHHTMDDTLDKVDPAQLNQNVAAWAAFIWLVADSDVDFRAIAAKAPKAGAGEGH